MSIMGINYYLESALKMKSVSGIIVIMKYLPLLLARFCQIQDGISAWLPKETLVTALSPQCPHVHTHTQWNIWRWRTKAAIIIQERVLSISGQWRSGDLPGRRGSDQ